MRLERLAFLTKRPRSVFESGVGAKLPQEYRKFYDEWRNTRPQPVHYIPYVGKKWIRNEETGEVKRVEDLPIRSKFCKELNSVFTGGETIVQGFVKKKKYSPRNPRFWVPKTYRSVIYSEILNKYMSVIMTNRVVDLIHKHQGLDNYLLQTKACDLVTTVALGLKRKLFLALRDKQLPYDEETNKKILEKYEKYLPPPEEIEWYGLNFTQACNKLKEIEKAREEASKIPLKHVYRANLIKELQEKRLLKEAKAV